MDFSKNIKTFIKSDNLLLEVLAAASFFIVAVPLWMFLHFWSLLILAVLLANILILITHYKKVSIPVISHLVAWEYKRIKAKSYLDKDIHRLVYDLEKNYLKFLHYLALLFRTMEDNHNLLIDRHEPYSIEFGKKTLYEKVAKKNQVRDEYLREFSELYHHKKKKALRYSYLTSAALVAGTTAASLIVSLLLNIFTVQAATYGWIQTDWSGGASSTATAVHPGDETGWKKFSTSTNISFLSNSTVLQMTSSTSYVTDTGTLTTSTDASFNYASGGGFANGIYSAALNFGTGSSSKVTLSASTANMDNVIPIVNNSGSIVYDSVDDAYWVLSTGNFLQKFNASTFAQVGATTTVSTTAEVIGYDPTQNVIWIGGTASIQRRDAATGALLTTTAATSHAYGFAFDSSQNVMFAAIATGAASTLRKYNSSTNALMYSTTTGPTGLKIAYDSARHGVWVISSASSTAVLYSATSATMDILSTITVGSGNTNIVYDSVQDAVWVVNATVIKKFNASTGIIVGTTTPFVAPNGVLMYDQVNNAVWAGLYSASGYVQKIDASNGTSAGLFLLSSGTQSNGALAYDSLRNMVWTKETGPGSANDAIGFNASTVRGPQVMSSTSVYTLPRRVTYDSTQNAVWVVSGDATGRLQKFDASTKAQVGSNISIATYPNDLVYDSRQNAVWVISYNTPTGKLQKFSAIDGTQIGSDITTNSRPYALTYDSAQNAVWVVNYQVSNMQKFDAFTGAQVGSTMTCTGGPEGIAYDATQNSVWVIGYTSSTMQQYNAATGAQIGSNITTCTNPNSITYDPAQNAVWVACYSNPGIMQKFNAATGVQIGSNIAINSSVAEILYDSTQNAIWVSGQNTGPGYTRGPSLEKFDAATGAKLSTMYTGGYGYGMGGIAFDPTQNLIWQVYRNGSALFGITAGVFNTPGTFTSASIDFSQGVSYSTLAWLPATQAAILGSNALQFQIATNNDNATWNYYGPDGTAGTYFTAINQTIASSTAGMRYLRYKAYLASAAPSSTPLLTSVTINYSKYATSSDLISSKYDSGSSSNVVPKITWLGSGTSTNVTLQMQIRSASTSADLDTAAWCGYADVGDTCDGTHYFDYTQNGKTITNVNHPLMHGGNDEWFQYRIVMTSDGTATPSLTSVNTVYVVNSAPEFASSTTASQRTSDGKVAITYSALDSDTASSGVGCPLCVVPSFEYSTNNGSSWTAITSGYLSASATASTTVNSSTPSTYTVLWDAKSQINGISTTTAKIRITINDAEGASNTAVSSTPAFSLDVKNPVPTGTGVQLIASTSPTLINLNAADDNPMTTCISTSLSDIDSHCHTYNSTSTITLGSYTRIYTKFVDAYQNSYSVTTDAPETPTNLVIRDISDVTTPAYQELIAWKAVAGSFSKYHVYFSTDGSTYQEVSSIADRSINYFFHQNLTGGATYYYKVYVEDSNGNASQFSSVVSDITDGVGGTNTTPPAITNVQVISTTTQSAVIEWDTVDLANSNVHFSVNSAPPFNDTTGVVSLVDNAAGVGRHHVVLTGLTPDKPYYFSVESENALGIATTDNNGGGGYTFRTVSGPQITDVTTNAISNSGATIIWNTDIAADSYVYYSTSSDLSNYGSANLSTLTANHSVTLTSLNLGTTYYYYVKSGVATDDNGGAYYSFNTSRDNVAPVISVVSSTVVTDVNALITWTTNELADSKVDYGTNSGTYTASVSDPTFSADHKLLLSGLSTSTAYYYKVTSNDASSNLSSSTEYSFTTLETLSQESAVLLREAQATQTGTAAGAASVVCGGGGGASIDRTKPVISQISVEPIGANIATIKWSTSKVANSIIEYGAQSGVYDLWSNKLDSVLDHSIVLKSLDPVTTYYYRINSIDSNGNTGTGQEASFTTLSSSQDAASASSLSSGEKESMYIAAMNKAISIMSQLGSQVSVSTLESSLNSQYNLIRQLSDSVPVPLLSGEPRVLTTADTATITWHTDKKANSLVALAPEIKYDKTKGPDAYQQVVGNSNEAVTLHTVTVSDLEPETTYHYQVRSMSGIGGIGASSDFTFKTKPKELEISSYTVEKVNAQTAIFRWLTNNETDSSVKYTPFRNGVLAVDSSKTVSSKNFSTLHNITVDGFESGVLYEIELSGKDLKGLIISKKISSFSTGADNFPPTIYQVQTESALSTGKQSNVQTIISWLTDEPATSQVFYQKGVGTATDASWEKTPIDNNYSKKHIIVLTKFEVGQIYQFKIQSADSNNNLGVSKIYTILAPKQSESVFQVIMKNFEDIFGWTQQLNK